MEEEEEEEEEERLYLRLGGGGGGKVRNPISCCSPYAGACLGRSCNGPRTVNSYSSTSRDARRPSGFSV